MRILLCTAIVSVTILTCACTKNRVPKIIDSDRIAKIKVNRDGVILLNDQTVTIDELRNSLVRLSQSPGAAVWYYRENPSGEPHPNAMLVLQAIVDARLPVKLSTKPDFSDSVVPDGAPNPLR